MKKFKTYDFKNMKAKKLKIIILTKKLFYIIYECLIDIHIFKCVYFLRLKSYNKEFYLNFCFSSIMKDHSWQNKK